MTRTPDPDRLILAYLDEGVTELPDRVYEVVRSDIDRTRQRVVIGPWRTPQMNSFAKWAIAAAAVLVVALVGYSLLPSRGEVAAPSASASPSPSPSASASGPIPVLSAGPLSPGTYDARIPGTNIRVEFTVPAGWNWVDGWILTKSNSDAPNGHAIGFWSGDFEVYADPCHWDGEAPGPLTASTARELVDALAAQPLRGDSTPAARNGPAARAGLADWTGWTIDTTVPADADFSTCDRAEFRSWGPEANARYHQGPGQRDTVWALDASPRRSIAVVATSFPTTPEQTVAEIADILDSIRFSGS